MLTMTKIKGRLGEKEDLSDTMVVVSRRAAADNDILPGLRAQQTRHQGVPHQERLPVHEGAPRRGEEVRRVRRAQLVLVGLVRQGRELQGARLRHSRPLDQVLEEVEGH